MKADKSRGRRIKAGEAAADCPCPDEALMIASQTENPVAAEGTGISRVMAEIFDTEAVSIEDIDPGAVGSNVEEAGVSLIKRANLRMREAGRVRRVRQEAHEILTVKVELADAAVGTGPQNALGVEVERNDPVIG